MSAVTRTRWVTFGCYGTLVPRVGEMRPAASGGAPALRRVPRLLDGVEEMLAALRQRGYRLAVLTNADGELFESTHRAFRTPFDLFVTADRIRGYKPAPWHFRAFELITRVRKVDWVHVASSWRHDIVPAASFGIGRVWLDRGRTDGDPAAASRHVYAATEVAGAVDLLLDGAIDAEWSAARDQQVTPC